MFDPTVGRWLEEDPIGFGGGDANLYRFVGNSPTNFTDPSGLKFSMKVGDEWKEGKEAEDLFFKQLGDTDALKRVIKALRENAEFKKIWDYLRQSEWDIELKVTPGLTKPGTKVQIFGGFFRHKLELNPTMPKIKDNPLELADTLIHEAIHAAIFILDQTREKKTYPLAKEVMDISSDPTLGKAGINGFTGMSKKAIAEDPKLKEYCEKNYGDFAPPGDPPRTTYIDINKPAQEIIVRIIDKLLEDATIKMLPGAGPTITSGNLKLMKGREEK